jgi:DNA-binding FrmR family transcriptional regulator
MSKQNIENRLKRLEGQIASVRSHIEQGTACDEVILQFLAIKGACNAAFEAYVKASLADCPAGDFRQRDQLISMLLKH